MKVLIAGGTGQVGSVLARAFHRDGHEVVILSRNAHAAAWRTVQWDATTLGDWAHELDTTDLVINLAGRSVNCRYGRENRRAMLESRVLSTRVVGQAIAAARRPPPLWLQASTATIYAHRYDAGNDELTGILGGDEAGAPDTWRFSIEVAKAWEREVEEARLPSTRKVLLRSAMTMSPDKGGIFDTLCGLVHARLGGRIGNGKQYISWIHETDFVRAIYWLVENDLHGPVNLAAPNPLPQMDFMAALRDACGIGFGLPASRWMVEVGAFFMRTETELILKSRRVVPRRLLDEGFEFLHPSWPEAARELSGRVPLPSDAAS